MLSSTFFAAERFFGRGRDSFFAFFIGCMKAVRSTGEKPIRAIFSGA